MRYMRAARIIHQWRIIVSIRYWMTATIIIVITGNNNIVNQEYFVVKIFSDNLACAKIKHAKYMCIIIINAVRGRCPKII